MRHSDEDALALLALGEPVSGEVTSHVATCDACADEVRRLGAVVATVRTDLSWDPLPADQEVPPPPSVWAAIAAETRIAAAPSADGTGTLAVRPVAEPPAIRPTRTSARPTRPARGPLLAAAAAALVVGLAAGALGAITLRDDPPPVTQQADGPERTLLSGRLGGLPAAPSAFGTVTVLQTEAGRRLDLDVSALGIADGYYEVWIMDTTISRMMPIGVLRGTEGRFVLPDGVNLRDYPVVDVSVEPLDGNPAHSGTSVLRGTIGT